MDGAGDHAATVPVLDDGTVRLRAHTAADLAGIVEQCQDPVSRRWLPLPDPYGPREAEEFLALVRSGWLDPSPSSPRYWAVQASDDQGRARFAGSVDYSRDGRGGGELGYGLHPWARGRGVGLRAVRLVLAHAFGHDGLHLVRWRAARGNFASRRLAWRAGFVVEGTVRGLLPHPSQGLRDGWVGSVAAGEPRAPAHRWLDAPVLAGQRVRLRPWREDDGDRLPPHDQAARTFMAPVLPPEDPVGYADWLLRTREQMAGGEMLTWCLADPDGDRPLGWLALFALDRPYFHGSGRLGYWLSAPARGRGVMTEALTLATRHGFAPAPGERGDTLAGLGLHRLGAAADVRNTASQAVLRGAGWRVVGTEREATVYRPGGPRYDAVQFELLAGG